MTTNDNPTTGSSEQAAAEVTWESLTNGERVSLRMGDGYHPYMSIKSLLEKGLMQNSGRKDKYPEWYERTPLGKQVLAQAQQPPAVPASAGGETVTTIRADEWHTVAGAWQQGKAVIRDIWGDMIVNITQQLDEYIATDVYGESWPVNSAKCNVFTVEWFTMPDPLPDPEDIADEERGEHLVELFKRVEVRLEYVQNQTIEGYPLEEETRLEKWLDNAADYLPMWYHDAVKDNEQPPRPVDEKPRHEWQELAPDGKVWLAEMLTDKVQQVMPFESRWDGQEWLDGELMQYHPEHAGDSWFESESGSALTWHGTNDLSLTLVDIQKATKRPVDGQPTGEDTVSENAAYREAHAAWNDSERGWVNLANLLGVPYEMTSSAEMIANVKQLQARLEISKYELGNYAVKILDTIERVFDTEVVKFGDKSMPDPDELIHIWVSKTTELQAALAIQKLKSEGEVEELIELDAERIGDIEDLRSRLATSHRENEALRLALVQSEMTFQEVADYAESEYTTDATIAIIARTGERLARAALTTPPDASMSADAKANTGDEGGK